MDPDKDGRGGSQRPPSRPMKVNIFNLVHASWAVRLVMPNDLAISKTITLQTNEIDGNSSILNSIFLAGGDNSGGDLGHNCAEIIAFGLRVLSVSGRLPCIPII